MNGLSRYKGEVINSRKRYKTLGISYIIHTFLKDGQKKAQSHKVKLDKRTGGRKKAQSHKVCTDI